ncbi:NAD dependent epimerase/dehydratase [Phlyctema vagabunda]|uniref:NAD dependent epimerase/dehydratase n=1 Tax=Phlyctema vagabunda TaxID=108571 RepID=A0ABR4P4Q2_9HELO
MSSPAIPLDSTVLVTGINGYLGSHTADQLLEAGYKVRGTTRDLKKTEGLVALWEKKYGKGRVEIVIVEDMTTEGAFDEAVKGVSGVAHVASILTFSPDPNLVIPGVLASIRSILKSTAASPSVKRFVYTSSSIAATAAQPNTRKTVALDSWNEADIEKAWAPPPYTQDRAISVYGASKAQGEKAVWEFVKENKPQFVVNAVLPNCNFGKILDRNISASSGDFPPKLLQGKIEGLEVFNPQWFVDVQDTGRLHVAALVDASIQNERLFAFGEPFNWPQVLSILRKIRPDYKIPADFSDPNERDLMEIPNQRAADILRGMGRPGFTSLEESITANVEGL